MIYRVRSFRRLVRRVFGLMALVLLAGALVPVSSAAAVGNSYYVSPSGNDNDPGDATRPFRTIQQCANKMMAGDTCIIGPGTYRETVTPRNSGTEQAPITYRAQTPGTVRIDGTQPVTGWTKVTGADLSVMSLTDQHIVQSPFAAAVNAGKVYKAQVALNNEIHPELPLLPRTPDPEEIRATAEQLFLGGDMMRDAQFPDATPDPLEPKVQVAKEGSNQATIADPELNQSAGYWNGAHVYVQTNWKALTYQVKNSAPGTISVSSYPGYATDFAVDACAEITPYSTRYFLYGKLSELNQPREWFYHKGNQTLYFRPPEGMSPDTATFKQRLFGFDLRGKSDIRLDELDFFGTTIRTGDTSQRVVLSGLNVTYPSHFQDFRPSPALQQHNGCDSISAGMTDTGIIVRGTQNVVRDSKISWSAGNGIALLGNGNTATNNVIHDVDYSGGRGAGIGISGNDHRVTGNTIYSSGRAAIESKSELLAARPDGWTDMRGVTIAYNDMYEYGRLSQDYGGVYICCRVDLHGSSIDHNWVHDPRDMATLPAAGSIGIYIDSSSANQTIQSNVGWNNPQGTIGLINGDVTNAKLYNNNGHVYLYGVNNADRTEILNNIGSVIRPNSTATNLKTDAILDSATNPLYTDEPARDFSLLAGSPAIGTGRATRFDGVQIFTDPTPDRGAYQQAEPYWRPGATGAPTLPIRVHYGASQVNTDTENGDWNDGPNALQRYDFPNDYAYMCPGSGSGTLRLAFARPSGAGLAIDKVELRLYARMHREPSASGNMTVDIDGRRVWNAGAKDFDATGRAITVPLTTRNWSELPLQVDVRGELAGGTPDSCHIQGQNGTYLWLFAAEIYIEAHRT